MKNRNISSEICLNLCALGQAPEKEEEEAAAEVEDCDCD